MTNGVPLTMTGVITYNFSIANGAVTVTQDVSGRLLSSSSRMPAAPTAEELRLQKLKEKLHAWLYAVVGRLTESDDKTRSATKPRLSATAKPRCGSY